MQMKRRRRAHYRAIVAIAQVYHDYYGRSRTRALTDYLRIRIAARRAGL